MKKLLTFALTLILVSALVLPVSAGEETFDITEYPSDATPDKCGATVEAYRFVYDADRAGNKWLTGKYVHSLPKLTYETETAQSINQKILDDFNEYQAWEVWCMVEEEPTYDGTNHFSKTSYMSLIDSKGIVVIVVKSNGGVWATDSIYWFYNVYYYSPETDSELSVDEYLALHGTSREEISARFSDENDDLKYYHPESKELVHVPAEDVNFAIYYADGTETVCAEVPDIWGYKDSMLFGNQFAPQTSLTAVTYAAVAALALGVVVVKKKH